MNYGLPYQGNKSSIVQKLRVELKKSDPDLREVQKILAGDLEREVAALSDRRAFGLNFERHVPEVVDLPGRRIRKGDKVRISPIHGKKKDHTDKQLWHVVKVNRTEGTATIELLAEVIPNSELNQNRENQSEPKKVEIENLIVVAEFRDSIYPGLSSTERVERGGDKPFHTVIAAENYHALETILFSHRGKVDCIYIDPPYNTGAKDWKYNNNYVENDDLYRHSKWLAFLERRLILAKELLNPDNSVLIVTIDEKEVHRLGLLLEQTFPGSRVQMATIVISPLGQERVNELARVEEYAFFIFLGAAGPTRVKDDLLNEVELNGDQPKTTKVRWEWLLRGGGDATRRKSPNLFYPVFIDTEFRKIVRVGDPLPLETSRDSVSVPDGLLAVWPLRTTGDEGRWRCSSKYLRELIEKGYARVGDFDKRNDRWSISYLGKAQIARVESGEIEVIGRADSGEVQLGTVEGRSPLRSPKTVWNRLAHRAGEYGTSLNRTLIPGRTFPYPKSLYAVEDALRIAVGDNKDALIVDFFAGSGTTTHAVMRLNKQDNGRRKTVIITNNEVAADEHKSLREQGHKPGDPDWEKWGICEYITKPRIKAAVTGVTPEGKSLEGSYKFTDEFPMSDGFEENVEFFTFTYEAPLRVSSNREFRKIAPLLWIYSGSIGRRIEDISGGWDVSEKYGVLADLDQAEKFQKKVSSNKNIRVAFIITDEDRLFESLSSRLPPQVESVRLCEAYLRNFEIESRRGAFRANPKGGQ